MNITNRYDEDYFLRGKETGKSLYENYHWMPDLTIPMVGRIVAHLGIAKGERVLDFGCARGYVVKALRLLGHEAFGVDISEWAIRNADEDTKTYLTLMNGLGSVTPSLDNEEFDWIIAKDVLEHVYYVAHTVTALMHAARKGVFAVVPLSVFEMGNYVIEDYEKDVTHIQRHTMSSWISMFLQPEWSVEASYHVRGIKDNWYQPGWERGNGFILARRISE